MLAHIFGPEAEWPDHDLIGFSDEFDAGLTVAAYQSGVFPMPLDPLPAHATVAGARRGITDQSMFWWSPLHRGVLALDDLVVSRSLRKSAKRYTTSIDQSFDEVLRRCADPTREGSWIDDRIAAVYLELHAAGIVHSVEVWDAADRLVGGLYGVSLNGLFAGESMFHDPEHGRDASKVALIRLVEELTRGLPSEQWRTERLLDVQWRTDHLASLGVSEVPRRGYLQCLDRALEATPVLWPHRDASRRPVLVTQEGDHA